MLAEIFCQVDHLPSALQGGGGSWELFRENRIEGDKNAGQVEWPNVCCGKPPEQLLQSSIFNLCHMHSWECILANRHLRSRSKNPTPFTLMTTTATMSPTVSCTSLEVHHCHHCQRLWHPTVSSWTSILIEAIVRVGWVIALTME